MDVVFSVCIVTPGAVCSCMRSMSVSSCRCYMFVIWVGGDSRPRIVERITEEGQVFRLEGGNKRGKCFSSGEVDHIAVSCHRNAWSENEKQWLRGKRVVMCTEG